MLFDIFNAANAGTLSNLVSPGYSTIFMRALPDLYWMFGFHYAAYALLMEFVVNRFVRSRPVVLFISGAMGGLSGAQLGLVPAVIGVLTGFILGELLVVLYRDAGELIAGSRKPSG